MRATCPKCGLHTNHMDGPRGPEACPYDRLVAALGPGFSASPAELRFLRWLAGMDSTEVACGLFQRLRGSST